MVKQTLYHATLGPQYHFNKMLLPFGYLRSQVERGSYEPYRRPLENIDASKQDDVITASSTLMPSSHLHDNGQD